MSWHWRPRPGGVLSAQLWRHTAAACLCSLSIGWLIGVWGGLTAMPTFASRFFPESAAAHGAPAGAAASAPPAAPPPAGHSGGASYCLFDDQLLSLGGSVIYLAALPALAAAAAATDRFGRLPTMWATAALLAGGGAAGAGARTLADVFVARVLLGMAMGCSFQAPTMLLSEVLPRDRRGAGMYAYNVAMLAGFLAAAVANQLLQHTPWGWRLSAGLAGAPGVALAALLPFVRESPQALLQRGDDAAAARALAALRPPGDDTSCELSQMRAAAARAGGGAGGKPRSQARALCGGGHAPELTASVLYPLVLMLTGLNVLSSWMPNLLLALGAAPGFALGGNTLMMVVGLAAALPATFFVERVGRRTLLAAGGATVAATMAALAALLAVALPAGGTGAGAGAPSPAVLPAALALLCINRIALSCTLQPLAATVPAEVQPLEIRSAASSLTTAVRNGSSFFVTQFALPLLCSAQWGLFLIFAGCTAAGTLLLWALVPETRGLPLEEVHLAWAGHWFWGGRACVRARMAAPAGGGGGAPEPGKAAGGGSGGGSVEAV
ncbi:MAG: general substrate transporter [Monoraphidium minutum]|nr:MAG: general substrate transporter [Monoraphidium minutum]